ncbi:unnamed protein product [Parajaminaea phylloscopi]
MSSSGSVVATLRNTDVPQLEERCRRLIHIARLVQDFYANLDAASLEDASLLCDRARLARAHELILSLNACKEAPLLPETPRNHHFIDIGELIHAADKLDPGLEHVRSLCLHAAFVANGATFLDFVWGLPTLTDDTASVSLSTQTWKCRSLGEIEEAGRAFLRHVVPPETSLRAIVLELHGDLCTQVFIARLRDLTTRIQAGSMSADEAEAEAEADLSELLGDDAIDHILQARPDGPDESIRSREQWTALARKARDDIRLHDYDQEDCVRAYPIITFARRITEFVLQVAELWTIQEASSADQSSFATDQGDDSLPNPHSRSSLLQRMSWLTGVPQAKQQAWLNEMIMGIEASAVTSTPSMGLRQSPSVDTQSVGSSLQRFSSEGRFTTSDAIPRLSPTPDPISASLRGLTFPHVRAIPISTSLRGRKRVMSDSLDTIPSDASEVHRQAHDYHSHAREHRINTTGLRIASARPVTIERASPSISGTSLSSRRGFDGLSVATGIRYDVMKDSGLIDASQVQGKPDRGDSLHQRTHRRLRIRNGAIVRATSMPEATPPIRVGRHTADSGQRLSRFDSQSVVWPGPNQDQNQIDLDVLEADVSGISPQSPLPSAVLGGAQAANDNDLDYESQVYASGAYIRGIEVQIVPPPLSPRTHHLASQGFTDVEIPRVNFARAAEATANRVEAAVDASDLVQDDPFRNEIEHTQYRALLPPSPTGSGLFEGDSDSLLALMRESATLEYWFKRERPGFETLPVPIRDRVEVETLTSSAPVHRSQARDAILGVPQRDPRTTAESSASPGVNSSTAPEGGVLPSDEGTEVGPAPGPLRRSHRRGGAVMPEADSQRTDLNEGVSRGQRRTPRETTPWTSEETQCLRDAMYKFARHRKANPRYPVYAEILSRHGKTGSEDRLLASRSNVELKRKALEELQRMAMEGQTLPYWKRLCFPHTTITSEEPPPASGGAGQPGSDRGRAREGVRRRDSRADSTSGRSDMERALSATSTGTGGVRAHPAPSASNGSQTSGRSDYSGGQDRPSVASPTEARRRRGDSPSGWSAESVESSLTSLGPATANRPNQAKATYGRRRKRHVAGRTRL